MSASRPAFQWDDALLLDSQLTEEERMVRDSARAYCQEQLLPRVLTANREERFDRDICRVQTIELDSDFNMDRTAKLHAFGRAIQSM